MAPVPPRGPLAVPAAAAPPTRLAVGVARSLGPSVLEVSVQGKVEDILRTHSRAFFLGPGRLIPSFAELGLLTPALRAAVAVDFLLLASAVSLVSPSRGVFAEESSTSDLASADGRFVCTVGDVPFGNAARASEDSLRTMTIEPLAAEGVDVDNLMIVLSVVDDGGRYCLIDWVVRPTTLAVG